MTVIVIWPGATAQQIQDEVLNRMEKKFEQLDHFEKVKTYARQGYGGMTITVVGGTSQGGPARSLVPGAQEVQRHQARAARRRHRPDLQRRIRRRDRAALRREGRRHQPRGALRRRPKTSSGGCSRCRWSRRSTSTASRRRRSTSSSRTSGSPRSASRRCRSPKACATRTACWQAARSTRAATACSCA